MSRMRMRITHRGMPPGKPPSVLQKVLAVAAAVVLLGVALLFSVVLLAVLLTLGVIAGGYMWWKTRALRKQLRERVAAMQAAAAQAGTATTQRDQGEVIEGEYSKMPPAAEDAPARRSPDR